MSEPLAQETALSELRSELEHLIEQAEKNQWWNVISLLNRTQRLAIRRFDAVLKDADIYGG